MSEFKVSDRDVGCKLCPLWEGCKSVCIPTREHLPKLGSKLPSLLILGESPGYQEDRNDRVFCGKSGNLLTKLYLPELDGHARIYLGNAVRCFPGSGVTPPPKSVTACKTYLERDVNQISRGNHPVTILAVGSTAAKSTAGFGSIKEALKHQGVYCKVGDYQVQVFFTYHPAAVLRNPSLFFAVRAHLHMVRRALQGNPWMVKADELGYGLGGIVPRDVGEVALDIETYGAIKGSTQRFFHPVLSEKKDGVPLGTQIETVTLFWKDPKMGRVYGTLYDFQGPDRKMHQSRLKNFLIRAGQMKTLVVGHNINFDRLYLELNFPEWKPILDRIRWMDTNVASYLYFEERPERSLKQLAYIFGVAEYGGLDKGLGTYERGDLDLYKYNCLDAAVTIVLWGVLRSLCKSTYGKDTSKFTPDCLEWYRSVLDLVYTFTKVGIGYDASKLLRLGNSTRIKQNDLIEAASDIGFILKGKGAGKSTDALVDEIMSILPVLPPELERTEKKNRISLSAMNRNTLKDLLWVQLKNVGWSSNGTSRGERSTESRLCGGAVDKLEFLSEYKDTMGLLSRYIDPLLKDDATAWDGIMYPSWFVVPSEGGRDRKGTPMVGGTKQGRLSAKDPPVQTFPPKMKEVYRCRFPGGKFIVADYSNLEYRVAGLLSQDSNILDAYDRGEDLHKSTAIRLFGEDGWEEHRQTAKTINFAMLYRGGPAMIQSIIRKFTRKEVELSVCRGWLQELKDYYVQLHKWQDELIRSVDSKGWLSIGDLGHTRIFLDGRGEVSRIVNAPVQCHAANITISAHIGVQVQLRKWDMVSVSGYACHDSIGVEAPKGEIDQVRVILREEMSNPWYYRRLRRKYKRSPELTIEMEEK